MTKTKRILDQETVVSKAAEIADDIGLERLTMSVLADHLNVRPPSIYNHVKNIDDLYNQLTLKGLRDLNTILDRAVEKTNKKQFLSAISHAVRDFAKEHPTLFLCASRDFSMGSEEYIAATDAFLASMNVAFSRLGLSKEKSAVSQMFLRCLLNGFISLEANNALEPANDNDKLFAKLIKMASVAINS